MRYDREKIKIYRAVLTEDKISYLPKAYLENIKIDLTHDKFVQLTVWIPKAETSLTLKPKLCFKMRYCKEYVRLYFDDITSFISFIDALHDWILSQIPELSEKLITERNKWEKMLKNLRLPTKEEVER